MCVYLINKLQTIKWNCQQSLPANCWKSLTFPTGATCWCACALACVYKYVCASVCAFLCVCPLDKAELIWPHTKKVRKMGRGAWPGTNDPRRVHRVCADCCRCCCYCWAFTDAGNCSRSCGELKSTHLKANVTWNRLEIESQCRAALPPVPVPYQIYNTPWVAACGCLQLWPRLVGVEVSWP